MILGDGEVKPPDVIRLSSFGEAGFSPGGGTEK